MRFIQFFTSVCTSPPCGKHFVLSFLSEPLKFANINLHSVDYIYPRVYVSHTTIALLIKKASRWYGCGKEERTMHFCRFTFCKTLLPGRSVQISVAIFVQELTDRWDFSIGWISSSFRSKRTFSNRAPCCRSLPEERGRRCLRNRGLSQVFLRRRFLFDKGAATFLFSAKKP